MLIKQVNREFMNFEFIDLCMPLLVVNDTLPQRRLHGTYNYE